MNPKDAAIDLAERLEFPPEAVSGAVKVTVWDRRQAAVEHHRGLLGYSREAVEINAGRTRVRILGTALELRAMDRETVVVTGNITAVEYV